MNKKTLRFNKNVFLRFFKLSPFLTYKTADKINSFLKIHFY